MDVRQVIVTTLSLAGLPLSGCASTVSSDDQNDSGDSACPSPTPFSLDDALVTVQQLEARVDAEGAASPEELTCASVCEVALGGDGIESLQACAFELDPDYLDSLGEGMETGTTGAASDPQSVAAIVTCSGSKLVPCLGGRRPMGHVEALSLNPQMQGPALGSTLAAFASLERASVQAFIELAERLEGWGAPAELVERCEAAAAEEVEHAEAVAAMARRHGGEPPAPRSEDSSADLFAFALHNAVEGCVVETWSALLAHRWAEASSEEELRSLFARIAEDETRHAQLSWDLHRWFESQLDDAQRGALAEARHAALSGLPDRARREAALLPSELGSPGPRDAAALAAEFAVRLAA